MICPIIIFSDIAGLISISYPYFSLLRVTANSLRSRLSEHYIELWRGSTLYIRVEDFFHLCLQSGKPRSWIRHHSYFCCIQWKFIYIKISNSFYVHFLKQNDSKVRILKYRPIWYWNGILWIVRYLNFNT